MRLNHPGPVWGKRLKKGVQTAQNVSPRRYRSAKSVSRARDIRALLNTLVPPGIRLLFAFRRSSGQKRTGRVRTNRKKCLAGARQIRCFVSPTRDIYPLFVRGLRSIVCRLSANSPLHSCIPKSMSKPQSSHSPDGSKETATSDDMVVNDSLGTINVADSSGLDKEKETDDERDGFVKKGGGDPNPQD